MSNRFHGILPPAGPSVSGFAVAPNDTENQPEVTRGIWVGTAGNIAVIFSQDPTQTPVILQNMAAGVVHPLSVSRILATGTTALNIVGLV